MVTVKETPKSPNEVGIHGEISIVSDSSLHINESFIGKDLNVSELTEIESLELLQSCADSISAYTCLMNKAFDNIKKQQWSTIYEKPLPNQLSIYKALGYSTQKISPILEKSVIDKIGGIRIRASEDRGDFLLNGKYYELKTSFSNEKKTLNARQIRPHQEVDSYLLVYIDDTLNSVLAYELSNECMKNEIALSGSHSHMTSKANTGNINHEYSLTFPVYSKKSMVTRRFNEHFSSELSQLLMG